MKRMLIYLCLFVFFGACSSNTNDEVCRCMQEYQVTAADEIKENTLQCLANLEVELSLENEETAQLIVDMEPNCGMGSRKLWKLCRDRNE